MWSSRHFGESKDAAFVPRMAASATTALCSCGTPCACEGWALADAVRGGGAGTTGTILCASKTTCAPAAVVHALRAGQSTGLNLSSRLLGIDASLQSTCHCSAQNNRRNAIALSAVIVKVHTGAYSPHPRMLKLSCSLRTGTRVAWAIANIT